jgi:hypothetical protein
LCPDFKPVPSSQPCERASGSPRTTARMACERDRVRPARQSRVARRPSRTAGQASISTFLCVLAAWRLCVKIPARSAWRHASGLASTDSSWVSEQIHTRQVRSLCAKAQSREVAKMQQYIALRAWRPTREPAPPVRRATRQIEHSITASPLCDFAPWRLCVRVSIYRAWREPRLLGVLEKDSRREFNIFPPGASFCGGFARAAGFPNSLRRLHLRNPFGFGTIFVFPFRTVRAAAQLLSRQTLAPTTRTVIVITSCHPIRNGYNVVRKRREAVSYEL